MNEPPYLPDSWITSDRTVPRKLARPLRTFLETEVAGGFVLLAATVVALVWANSPFHESYEALWHTELRIAIGGFEIAEDLRHWVNDALMALFFFVVGLEIKRELVAGELSDPRNAALPAIAALGGMILPAVLYLLVNAGGDVPIDESPDVYKPAKDVIAAVVDAGLAEVTTKLTPIASIKGVD